MKFARPKQQSLTEFDAAPMSLSLYLYLSPTPSLKFKFSIVAHLHFQLATLLILLSLSLSHSDSLVPFHGCSKLWRWRQTLTYIYYIVVYASTHVVSQESFENELWKSLFEKKWERESLKKKVRLAGIQWTRRADTDRRDECIRQSASEQNAI